MIISLAVYLTYRRGGVPTLAGGFYLTGVFVQIIAGIFGWIPLDLPDKLISFLAFTFFLAIAVVSRYYSQWQNGH